MGECAELYQGRIGRQLLLVSLEFSETVFWAGSAELMLVDLAFGIVMAFLSGLKAAKHRESRPPNQHIAS
jgi:hypothetical protein